MNNKNVFLVFTVYAYSWRPWRLQCGLQLPCAQRGATAHCTWAWRAHGVPLVCHRALPRIQAAARPRGATALLRALVAPDSAGRVDCHVVQPSKLGRSCVRGCLQSMQRERQTPSKGWHLDNETEDYGKCFIADADADASAPASLMLMLALVLVLVLTLSLSLSLILMLMLMLMRMLMLMLMHVRQHQHH